MALIWQCDHCGTQLSDRDDPFVNFRRDVGSHPLGWGALEVKREPAGLIEIRDYCSRPCALAIAEANGGA